MRVFSDDELVAFVYREARLLDERRYDEWLSMYADDARYWMPLSPDQPDTELHGALMDEDLLLLRNPHRAARRAPHVLAAAGEPRSSSAAAAAGRSR